MIKFEQLFHDRLLLTLLLEKRKRENSLFNNGGIPLFVLMYVNYSVLF